MVEPEPVESAVSPEPGLAGPPAQDLPEETVVEKTKPEDAAQDIADAIEEEPRATDADVTEIADSADPAGTEVETAQPAERPISPETVGETPPELEPDVAASTGEPDFNVPEMPVAPPPIPVIAPPAAPEPALLPPPAPAISDLIEVETAPTDAVAEDVAAAMPSETGPETAAEIASPAPPATSSEEGRETPGGDGETQPPQAPDQVAVAESDSIIPSGVRDLTKNLDRTVDVYLGGWFVRWIGKKIGVVDEPEKTDEGEQIAQSGIEAPGTGQTAELPPRENAEQIEEPAADETQPPSESQEIGEDVVAQIEESGELGDEFTLTETPPATPVDTTEQIPAQQEAAQPLDSAPTTATIPTPAEDAETADLAEQVEIDAEMEETVDDAVNSNNAVSDENSLADATDELNAEFDATTELDAEIGTDIGAEADIGADLKAPAEVQIAEVPDDPFAPDAVPPGSAHPVIGEKPLVTPQPPEADNTASAEIDDAMDADLESELDDANSKVESPDAADVSSDTGELDALAGELGAEESDATAGDSPQVADTGDGKTDLMGQLSNFLEADDDPLPTDADDGEKTDGEPEPALDELDAAAADMGLTQTASLPPAVARQLPDQVLTIGESIHLTSAKPAPPDDPSEEPYCVEKNRGNTIFCVEIVDWPSDLAEELVVSTIMYQGTQTIVRYDEEQATRFHAIFPSQAFDSLISYYSRRFGEPTEISERTIAPFAQARQTNPIMLWRRDDPLSGKLTTLEIRRYDDARGGFPDLKHGVLMLSNAESPPIFPILSALDLMPTTGTK